MLTKSQKKTYDFIKDYIKQENISPTLQEVSLGLNIKSKGTISRYIQSLIDLGLLTKLKEKNTSRNLSLTNALPFNLFHTNLDSSFRADDVTDLTNNLNIPLVGTIAAGKPIEAISEDNNFNIQDIFAGEQLYMLRVKGDSMIEEGINNGDYVVCESRQTANNGEIVVALIDNEEATLKKIYKNNDGKILLCPANSNMAPMEYDATRVKVQGVLRCQLRSYS